MEYRRQAFHRAGEQRSVSPSTATSAPQRRAMALFAEDLGADAGAGSLQHGAGGVSSTAFC